MLIEDQVAISCDASRVWAATIDIDAWPAWVPSVQRARRLDEGAFGIGSEARLKQQLQRSTVWRVVEFEKDRHFAWETTGRLLHMRATHTVEPRAQGTHCSVTLELIGPMARFLGPVLRTPIKSALRQENEALKRWCEEAVVDPSPLDPGQPESTAPE